MHKQTNKQTNNIKAFLLTFVIFGLTTQPGQTAWLKAYSPGDGIPAIHVLKSPQGNFYLFGQKNSKQFAAKVDSKGHFKWGKLSLSPFRIDSAPLTLKPPFTSMFSSPDTASPLIWGKISQNDNNGAIKKLYAKTFAKPLDGKFQLVPHTNDHAKTSEYVIDGSVNSAVRNGPNIPGNDIAIAKVNTNNGKLAWSHIFGFDLGGMVPVTDLSFPYVTKSHGNYFFSRPINLLDPATGNFLNTFTVVGKLNGATGNLMGTPIMFDGIPAVHTTLQDGSVIVYTTVFNTSTSGSDLMVVKLDNNLNFLWGKRYGSASAAAYSLSLFPGFPELADGTLELLGFHIISAVPPLVLRPITIHISAVDGSIVVQKELQFGAGDSISYAQTAYNESNTPTLIDIFSGATDSIVSPGLRDIVYGKLDNNLSPLWVKSITGAAILNSQVVYPSRLFPRNNATTYTIEGIAQFGSAAPKMFLGSLDTNGNIPGCSILRDATPTLTTPDIVATDISSQIQMHPTTIVADFGALPTKVVDAKKTKLRVKNMKLKETTICK
jgi:hypothetical protein